MTVAVVKMDGAATHAAGNGTATLNLWRCLLEQKPNHQIF